MRFFSVNINFLSIFLPPGAPLKAPQFEEKCFMINTAEISMFNLNRWAVRRREMERERASDELAIMKIVYIIFLYASTI